jgi:hypothetical protein
MSRRTVAKVKLDSTETGDEQTVLRFSPDCNDGRNKEWAKYTPALSLIMTVLNEVAEGFEVNNTYDLVLMPNGGPAVTDVSSDVDG